MKEYSEKQNDDKINRLTEFKSPKSQAENFNAEETHKMFRHFDDSVKHKYVQLTKNIILKTCEEYIDKKDITRKNLIISNSLLKSYFKTKKEKQIKRNIVNYDEVFDFNDKYMLNNNEDNDININSLDLNIYGNPHYISKKIDEIQLPISYNISENVMTKYQIPKGIFVYPTNNNFRSEDKYELEYIVLINDYNSFSKILSSIKTKLENDYYEYPHNKDESDELQNENLILFYFINIVKIVYSNNASQTEKLPIALFPIVDSICFYFDKSYKLIYKTIYPLLASNKIDIINDKIYYERKRKKNKPVKKVTNESSNNINNKNNIKDNNNDTETTDNLKFSYYEKTPQQAFTENFCHICLMYCCNHHKYRTFERHVIADNFKVFKPNCITTHLHKQTRNIYYINLNGKSLEIGSADYKQELNQIIAENKGNSESNKNNLSGNNNKSIESHFIDTYLQDQFLSLLKLTYFSSINSLKGNHFTNFLMFNDINNIHKDFSCKDKEYCYRKLKNNQEINYLPNVCKKTNKGEILSLSSKKKNTLLLKQRTKYEYDLHTIELKDFDNLMRNYDDEDIYSLFLLILNYDIVNPCYFKSIFVTKPSKSSIDNTNTGNKKDSNNNINSNSDVCKYKCHQLHSLIEILSIVKFCSINKDNAYLSSKETLQIDSKNAKTVDNINKYFKFYLEKTKSPYLNYFKDAFKYNYIEIDKCKELFPTAGITSRKKLAYNYQKDKTGLTDYVPCYHDGPCTASNCDCIKTRGACEKHCNCFMYCDLLYKGCDCEKCDDNCKCATDLRECDPDICLNCKYKETCSNMKLSMGECKKLALGKSNICDSYGIYTLEDIEEGEFICEYLGEILNKDETERRSIFNDQLGLNYLFQVTNTCDIDAYRIGNEMR